MKDVAFDDLDDNIETSIILMDKILNTIIELQVTVPLQIQKVCLMLHNEVSKKFPDFRFKVIGAYFFLRFISPALSVLFVSDKKRSHLRRTAVIASKILTKLANERKFSSPDDSFVPFNDWLDENNATLHAIYEELLECDGAETKPSIAQNVLNESLMDIYQFLLKKMDEVTSKVNESRASNRLRSFIAQFREENMLTSDPEYYKALAQ
jgi:hypothetical protein